MFPDTLEETDSVRRARDSLLAQWEQHRLAIHIVKRQLNDLTLLGRLPNEILLEVFRWYVDICAVEWGPGAKRTPYTWIRVTWVCHRFRELCLATPTLWTRVVLTGNIKCTEIMLSRSQNAPLLVEGDTASSCSKHFLVSLCIVLKELYRIRSLDLRLSWNLYAAISVIPAALRKAPKLRHLKLAAPYLGRMATLPDMVFDNFGLGLEELVLYRYPWSWESLKNCSTLRHLSIAHDKCTTLPPPKIDEVLDALANLPHLVTLELQIVWARDNSLLDRERVVGVPTLKHLSLSGHGITCAALLDHLQLDQSTTISLTGMQLREGEHYSAFLPALASKIQPNCSKPIVAFSIGQEPGAIELSFWTDVQSIERKQYKLDAIKPKLCFDLPLCADSQLIPMWSQLPLSDVRSMWMSSVVMKGLYDDGRADILHGMENVVEVHLADWSLKGVSFVLTSVLEESNRGESDIPPKLCFPNMQTLVLDGLKFQSCGKPYEGGRYGRERCEDCRSGCGGKLESDLEIRKKRGTGIRRLVLKDCHRLSRHNIELLATSVDEIVWDHLRVSRYKNLNLKPGDSREAGC